MTELPLARILVTGGTGFIGRYVLERLAAAGLRPLVTTRTDASRADLVNLDLTDNDGVRRLIRSYRPAIVLHLAGATGHDDPTGEICNQVNFVATVNLLSALEEVGVERVILLGSAAEYGDQPTPLHEDMPARPVSNYGVSKARATAYALDRNRASGLPVVVLRIFSAYGGGQPAKMFLSQIITHAILNRRFNMSDGRQRRDFVHAVDAASGIFAAMTATSAPGRVINIGTGRGIPLDAVAHEVWKICGAGSERLAIGQMEKKGDDAFDTEADISRAGEILSWEPKRDLFAELPGLIDKMKETLTATNHPG